MLLVHYYCCTKCTLLVQALSGCTLVVYDSFTTSALLVRYSYARLVGVPYYYFYMTGTLVVLFLYDQYTRLVHVHCSFITRTRAK